MAVASGCPAQQRKMVFHANHSMSATLTFLRRALVGTQSTKPFRHVSKLPLLSLRRPLVATRQLSGSLQHQSEPGLTADATMIDDRSAPETYQQSAFVYPDVITKEEEEVLLQDLRGRMKLRRYQRGHWDAVIVQYKETELVEDHPQGGLSEVTLEIMKRIRSQLAAAHFPNRIDKNQNNKLKWLPSHAIQLHAKGELRAHVDSVRFSGDLVAGLSLGSSSIMRLRPSLENSGENDDDNGKDERETPPVATDADGFVDMCLPPRSLYAMTGPSRYLYSHELLGDGAVFGPNGIVVQRQDRFSIIFRDAKAEDSHSPTEP